MSTLVTKCIITSTNLSRNLIFVKILQINSLLPTQLPFNLIHVVNHFLHHHYVFMNDSSWHKPHFDRRHNDGNAILKSFHNHLANHFVNCVTKRTELVYKFWLSYFWNQTNVSLIHHRYLTRICHTFLTKSQTFFPTTSHVFWKKLARKCILF